MRRWGRVLGETLALRLPEPDAAERDAVSGRPERAHRRAVRQQDRSAEPDGGAHEAEPEPLSDAGAPDVAGPSDPDGCASDVAGRSDDAEHLPPTPTQAPPTSQAAPTPRRRPDAEAQPISGQAARWHR